MAKANQVRITGVICTTHTATSTSPAIQIATPLHPPQKAIWSRYDDRKLLELQVGGAWACSRTLASAWGDLAHMLHPSSPQARFGNKWTQIAAQLPGKSPNQCSVRWRQVRAGTPSLGLRIDHASQGPLALLLAHCAA